MPRLGSRVRIPSPAPISKFQGMWTATQVTVSKRIAFLNESLLFYGVGKVAGIPLTKETILFTYLGQFHLTFSIASKSVRSNEWFRQKSLGWKIPFWVFSIQAHLETMRHIGSRFCKVLTSHQTLSRVQTPGADTYAFLSFHFCYKS